MIDVYKYFNGHSPDIMNDILKLYTSYVQSPELSHLPDRKPSFIEIRTHAIPYRASQHWQQVHIDTL